MWLRIFLWALAPAVCVPLSGCANHQPSRPPVAIGDRRYIDLQPGWRILVVAPILKSGGYKMQLEETQNQNETVNIKAGKDFEGYETDYYDVRVAGNLLNINFRSGVVRHNSGSEERTSRPLVPLFAVSNNSRYVRLLFFTRRSDRDHDEAVLTASSPQQLDALTTLVQSDPAQNCRSRDGLTCAWVPAGVAVRPEKKRGREWVPAM